MFRDGHDHDFIAISAVIVVIQFTRALRVGT